MVAHLYWRINVSENEVDLFLAIAEMEMRASVGGADQCSGGTASASSSDGAAPPSNAFDNNATTRWSTPSGTKTGWLRYQFPTPVDVVEYTVRSHPTALQRAPKSWTLEYSDDGSSWTVADTRSNEANWAVGETRVMRVGVAFNAAGAFQYWRLNISNNNGATSINIAEIEMRAAVGGADQCSGGTASASSTYDASYSADKAVDNNSTSGWNSASFVASAWWRYAFAAPVEVVQYTIQGVASGGSYSPRAWKLQASNDGSTWYTADLRTNENSWGAGETRAYVVPSAPTVTPISGEAPVSLTGSAALELGTSLSGAAPAAITGAASLATGTHLSATARIEATPRGRLAGAAATPGAGNFFLLF